MASTQTITGTIAAYFEDNGNARQAVEALKEAGFSSAHIGVAHRGFNGTGSTAQREGTNGDASRTEGAASSTWDKVKNWFSGNEAEPYADERTRGDLATHEITAPADSDYEGGYSSSDLHGSFSGMEIPEERSRYFAHRLGKGGNSAVVTVNAGVRRDEAESILAQYGGDFAEDAAGYDYEGGTAYDDADATTESPVRGEREGKREGGLDNIQLLGEVLRVHKDRVNRGEVSIRKEVITENQTIQVPVTREELVIERHAVNDGTAVKGTIGESEVRVPLSEERASVEKATVVREEVSVGKRAVEDVRDLTDEVRREELVVDDPTSKRT